MTDRRKDTRIAAAEVALRLEDMIAATPALAGAQVSELLRLVPGQRALFSGRFKGRLAVFRLFLLDDAAKVARKEWQELTRAHAVLGKGPNRVPEPLAWVDDLPFYVMGFARGRLLMRHISRQPVAAQVPLIARAGDWFAAYTAPTVKPDRADPGPLLTRAREGLARQPHDILRQRETAILRELDRLAPRLAASHWHKAICHGDFHLNNLMIHRDTLTGFDLGGSGRPPMAKDIARALVHMARRDVLPTGDRIFGMDAGAFDALAAVLPEEDQALALPFCLGVDALARVELPQATDHEMALSIAMEDGLLDGLSRL